MFELVDGRMIRQEKEEVQRPMTEESMFIREAESSVLEGQRGQVMKTLA